MGTINSGGVRIGSKYECYQKGNSNRIEIPNKGIIGKVGGKEEFQNAKKIKEAKEKYEAQIESKRQQLVNQIMNELKQKYPDLSDETLAMIKDYVLQIVNEIIKDAFKNTQESQQYPKDGIEIANPDNNYKHPFEITFDQTKPIDDLGQFEKDMNNLMKQLDNILVCEPNNSLGKIFEIAKNYEAQETTRANDSSSLIYALEQYLNSLKNDDAEADTKSTKTSSVTLSYPQVLANKGITIHRRS